MKRVVVIGAGLGGMSAAARCAAQGFSVDVFEQSASVGGKASHVSREGCHFPLGPTVLTMPDVFEQFFRSVGVTNPLRLTRVDPACHYRWSSGAALDLPFSVDDVPHAIEDFSPGNGTAVAQYLRDAQEVYELTKDTFIFREFHGIAELFRASNTRLLKHLPKLRITKTLHQVHAERFKDPRLVQLFDRFATYNGSSPYKAPATLMVIPWVEMGLGAWHPDGGISAVSTAIANAAMQCGVRIHCNSRVQRINLRKGAVCSVVLTDGTEVDADHVISNADVFTTQRLLLSEHMAPPRSLSCSGIVLHINASAADRGLQHHNVLFADDYPAEFSALEGDGGPHPDATIYISRSCVSNRNHAPDGRENWFVLVNAPPLGRSYSNQQLHVEAIMRRLRSFQLEPEAASIHVRTPRTMEEEWGSFGGAIYGESSNNIMSAFMRPRQRSAHHKNLWYVGGSTHPGGGVPLVVIGGMIVSDLITTQEQSTAT